MGYHPKDDSAHSCPGPYLPAPYLPVKVDDVTLAFPARIGHLTPDPHDIPDAFWSFGGGRTTWNAFAAYWFGMGLPKEVGFVLQEGIDGNMAVRHLSAIMRSFQPKHEHKEAAVAYLSSLWFKAVVLDDAVLYGELPDDEEETS